METSPNNKKKSSPGVSEIFDTMDYGPAPESDSMARTWIDKREGKKFGHFIDNEWYTPVQAEYDEGTSPADPGSVLARTLKGTVQDVDKAVQSSIKAYESWSILSGHDRARHLYNLARHVQKHARLIAVVESLDNGKSIRETRDADVPIVVRHLYHYAGWAELSPVEMSNWTSVGVVGAIVPWNFPLMLLIWKLGPALAMGNTVILKPSEMTNLTALLFAEICAGAGLPPGVFNVVTGDGKTVGQAMALHPEIDKIAFTGSTQVGKLLRQLTAGSGKKLSLELGGKNPVIVYENADLDSAVESVVDAIWFNQGQVCSAGSKLLVQESIFEGFVDKLKTRLDHFRLGDSLDKAVDMGAVISQSHRKRISDYVEEARDEGADIFQMNLDVDKKGFFYPPTIITGVSTSSKAVMEEIFGPVVVVLPFRTAKEAVNLANNTMYGLAASVHSDQLPLALETAKKIKAGTVWINCHNIFDAAAGFGGYKQSGFGRDGGKEGLFEYVVPLWKPKKSIKIKESKVDLKSFGASYTAEGPESKNESGSIDRTYKLYYGGAQKRPDGNYSRLVRDFQGRVSAEVGQANRKDVRNAVEAAVKAQPLWEKKSGFNRSQILFYIAENLQHRKNEFASKIAQYSGKNIEEALKEVDNSIKRLFYWASYADKYGGTVQETQLYGTVIKIYEPMGVIGIACPSTSSDPLLGFVSLFAPAIARSNSVVIVPDETCPIPALDIDLPGGVVNVLTGSKDHLVKYLTEHQNVDSMWHFGSPEGNEFVESVSSVNVKRTWVDRDRDWSQDSQGQGEEFLYHSTQVKNIWLTMGDIFAN